jgi:maltose alpha-D-glucosyltransferase/alpha-amylase
MRRALVKDGTGADILAAAADLWSSWCNTAFLAAYLDTVGPDLVGTDAGAQEVLLRALLLDKAAYELRYELGHRPDWVPIPLQELLALADDA